MDKATATSPTPVTEQPPAPPVHPKIAAAQKALDDAREEARLAHEADAEKAADRKGQLAAYQDLERRIGINVDHQKHLQNQLSEATEHIAALRKEQQAMAQELGIDVKTDQPVPYTDKPAAKQA